MDPRTLDRRTFLGSAGLGALAAVASAAPSLAPRAAPPDRSRASLSFDEFVDAAREAVGEQADELVADPSPEAEARYLHALAAVAVRLRDVPVPPLRDTTADPAVAARTWLGANECDAPFTVLHWKLDPGARITPHPHTYGNVVTLCLDGEVRVQNHEVVVEGGDVRAFALPDFESSEPFVARRVVDQLLLPGAINLVPLHRGYVHGFVAGPGGARGLDLTTRFKPRKGRNAQLIVGDVVDAERGLWRASWRHS